MPRCGEAGSSRGSLRGPWNLRARSAGRPADAEAASFTQAFLIRMLFSCLVDADFLATEAFMSGGTIQRGVRIGMDTLQQRLAVPAGARIETLVGVSAALRTTVAPPAGARIETSRNTCHSLSRVFVPSWERGSKHPHDG